MSRLQNDPVRYRQVFLQAYGAIALMSFTFAGLLIGLRVTATAAALAVAAIVAAAVAAPTVIVYGILVAGAGLPRLPS